MTAYELRISDWSSDVCSSDLLVLVIRSENRNLLAVHCPAEVGNRHLDGFDDTRTAVARIDAGHIDEGTDDDTIGRPTAFALRDSARRLTWDELVIWADSVADDLSAAGVRRGDRVGIWLPNCVEVVVTFLACSRAGRSEAHTSELQSLMRISYAVFCLKKKK